MNYEEQVKALRHCMTKEDGITICAPCPYYGKGIECENVLHTDAAAAIEALQAEVKRLELDNEDYEYEHRRLKGEIEALQAKVDILKVSGREAYFEGLSAQPHWVSVEDEIPEDGEWAIFTNGKVITVERLKHDAYDHFYPPSKLFNFEDATYWMPLPEPPQEVQDA